MISLSEIYEIIKEGHSTQYYRDHPEARKKKDKKDKEINARPEQIKKRTQANKKRSQAKKRGKNVNGKDYDHAVDRFVKSSINRGRKGEGNR